MHRTDPPFWATFSDDELLELRLCDLRVQIDGTVLEERVRRLHSELGERGFKFRPHTWLSDDWFTPDGVPGFAVPFYMTHPRLMELERTQMLEVEGETEDWSMRILRHETGHAIDNAYRLRRKRRRHRIFGRSSEPYPERYSPKPYSKSYVVHLEPGYAQSHPDEDFAETFAVWLDPQSQWRSKYSVWPAMKKLEYVDELMREILSLKPPAAKRHAMASLGELETTLEEHYRARRQLHQVDFPATYDEDLLTIFSRAGESESSLSAAAFLYRLKKQMRRRVAETTGIYQYTIDQIIEEMIERCRKLDLRVSKSTEQTKLDFEVLLTGHAVEHLRNYRYRLAL
jgi:hypothetical protein